MLCLKFAARLYVVVVNGRLLQVPARVRSDGGDGGDDGGGDGV